MGDVSNTQLTHRQLNLKENLEKVIKCQAYIRGWCERNKFKEYIEFSKSCRKYEMNSHYTNLMCCKPTSHGPKQSKHKCIDLGKSILLPNRNSLKYMCVLPRGHSGKCSHKYDIFKSNSMTKKLKDSIEKKVYYTPGNDDYVYKNRSTRLYSKVLSKKEELKIRDTKKKKNVLFL